jgi:hypothetical protein
LVFQIKKVKNIMKVEWTGSKCMYSREIYKPSDLEPLIETVLETSDKPTMVELFDDSGLSIAIGVGHSKSVVTFQASLDPPYFISLGNKSTAGIIEFYYGDEETEYLAKNAVPFEMALHAAKEFLERRERPNGLLWEKL